MEAEIGAERAAERDGIEKPLVASGWCRSLPQGQDGGLPPHLHSGAPKAGSGLEDEVAAGGP